MNILKPLYGSHLCGIWSEFGPNIQCGTKLPISGNEIGNGPNL